MTVLLQRDYRLAAVQLVGDYVQSSGIEPFQLYRARPTSIKPPTGFVDRMSDRLVDFLGPAIFQHIITVQFVVLHGLFDHGNTVDQRDFFVDGFLDWVRTRYHAAGPNTLLRVTNVDDDPSYIPEWLAPERRFTASSGEKLGAPVRPDAPYYATIITLEGEATD